MNICISALILLKYAEVKKIRLRKHQRNSWLGLGTGVISCVSALVLLGYAKTREDMMWAATELMMRARARSRVEDLGCRKSGLGLGLGLG